MLETLFVAVLPLFVQEPRKPASLPASRPSHTLVVLNKSEASASLIDAATGETTVKLKIGAGPHEAAASPDGRTVVACNYGGQKPGTTLSVIDVPSGQVTRTIDLAPHLRPHGIQFLPDGERFVVTAETQRKLLVVHLGSGKVEAEIGTNQALSHMVALALDGKRAFVSNLGSGSMSVIDLEKQELAGVVPTGAGAEGIAVHPTRGEVWVTNRQADTVSVVDSVKLQVLAELPCPGFPIRVAFTPDGKQALVSCAHASELAVFDAEKRSLTKRIGTGAALPDGAEAGAGAMPVGVLVRPDGRFAYVANVATNDVAVVDLQTLAVTSHVRTGKTPDGMAWSNLRPEKIPAKAQEQDDPKKADY